MRILLVNTQLNTGGIATSLINLLEKLKNLNDVQVDILLLHKEDGDIRYKIPQNISLIKYDINKLYYYSIVSFRETLKTLNIIKIFKVFISKFILKIVGNEKFIKYIMNKSKVINGYDIAISFRNDEYQNKPYAIAGCNDFVQYCTDAKKKIAWIHNDPDRHGFTYDIAKEKFEKFDYIVNVSEGCKKRFDEIIPEYKHKSKLVYNTFNYDEIITKSTEYNPYGNVDKGIVKLVTVGRIDNKQKRMDRIVKVCERLKASNINNYIWFIVGDGPDAEQLKQEVIRLGLKDRIVFVGKQSNPFPYMKYADCLIMTSEYEAFPMTLNEALITGVPVITTNHISAQEIVKNGFNGFIAQNSTNGIEDKIKGILEDRQILDKLKNNIEKQEVDRNIAMNQFLQLIDFN